MRHLTHNKYVIHSQLNSLNIELWTQVSDISRSASSICTICYKKACWEEWALSMVVVEEGCEFRFRGDLYSQESTFPQVIKLFFLMTNRMKTVLLLTTSKHLG